jgi:hypothetical protein
MIILLLLLFAAIHSKEDPYFKKRYGVDQKLLSTPSSQLTSFTLPSR